MGAIMSDRFIKYLPSGVVYIYDTSWATNPEFIEVADAEGNPFPDTSENPEYEPAKPRAKLTVKAAVEANDSELALQADASRGMPK